MNKTINFIKAGIIAVINSPGGNDELSIYIVDEATFAKCQEILMTIRPFDPYKISKDIMDLLFDEDKQDISSNVLEERFLMSFSPVCDDFLNKYEIIGIIPINIY